VVDVLVSLVCLECADVLWLDACRGQKSAICVDKVIVARDKFAMFGN